MPFPYGLEDASSFTAEASEGKNIWAIIFQGRFVVEVGSEKELGYWLALLAGGEGIYDRGSKCSYLCIF